MELFRTGSPLLGAGRLGGVPPSFSGVDRFLLFGVGLGSGFVGSKACCITDGRSMEKVPSTIDCMMVSKLIKETVILSTDGAVAQDSRYSWRRLSTKEMNLARNHWCD